MVKSSTKYDQIPASRTGLFGNFPGNFGKKRLMSAIHPSSQNQALPKSVFDKNNENASKPATCTPK